MLIILHEMKTTHVVTAPCQGAGVCSAGLTWPDYWQSSVEAWRQAESGLARSRHRGCGHRLARRSPACTHQPSQTQLCGHSNLWPQTKADDEISRNFHNMRGRLPPGPSPCWKCLLAILHLKNYQDNANCY